MILFFKLRYLICRLAGRRYWSSVSTGVATGSWPSRLPYLGPVVSLFASSPSPRSSPRLAPLSMRSSSGIRCRWTSLRQPKSRRNTEQQDGVDVHICICCGVQFRHMLLQGFMRLQHDTAPVVISPRSIMMLGPWFNITNRMFNVISKSKLQTLFVTLTLNLKTLT